MISLYTNVNIYNRMINLILSRRGRDYIVLINFDNWEVDEDSPFGSGASEKKWLVNPITYQKGIF